MNLLEIMADMMDPRRDGSEYRSKSDRSRSTKKSKYTSDSDDDDDYFHRQRRRQHHSSSSYSSCSDPDDASIESEREEPAKNKSKRYHERCPPQSSTTFSSSRASSSSDRDGRRWRRRERHHNGGNMSRTTTATNHLHDEEDDEMSSGDDDSAPSIRTNIPNHARGFVPYFRRNTGNCSIFAAGTPGASAVSAAPPRSILKNTPTSIRSVSAHVNPPLSRRRLSILPDSDDDETMATVTTGPERQQVYGSARGTATATDTLPARDVHRQPLSVTAASSSAPPPPPPPPLLASWSPARTTESENAAQSFCNPIYLEYPPTIGSWRIVQVNFRDPSMDVSVRPRFETIRLPSPRRQGRHHHAFADEDETPFDDTRSNTSSISSTRDFGIDKRITFQYLDKSGQWHAGDEIALPMDLSVVDAQDDPSGRLGCSTPFQTNSDTLPFSGRTATLRCLSDDESDSGD